jgi:hypothetical protein
MSKKSMAIAIYLAIGFFVASMITDSVVFGTALMIAWPVALVVYAMVALFYVALLVLAVLLIIGLADKGEWLLEVKREFDFALSREREKMKGRR